jgi:hypothetical protein
MWKTGPGGLTITVKSLKPVVFLPFISLIAQNGETDVPFTPGDAVFKAQLSAAQVAQLIAAPTAKGAPFLFLTTHVAYKPGAPDRKWQWGIKMERDGTAFRCFDKAGAEIMPGPHGYVTCDLHSFPQGQGGGSETWIMSLA